MTRTTTCRSSRRGLAALTVFGFWAAPLAAQDTTQAAPARQELAQVPASHTVVEGETLWAIAILYFGDPLLWPEIYRLNTAVVEDPHWIYPGEVLNLAPLTGVAQGPLADTLGQLAAADTVRALAADTVLAAPFDTVMPDSVEFAVVEEPPVEAAETYETIFDRDRSQRTAVRNMLRIYVDQPHRPVRAGEFYSAGWLTEGERLPWGEVLGRTERSAITRLSEGSSAMRFEEIAVRPPRNASYHVGDSLLLARLDRGVMGWGEVVVPVGVARVTTVQDRQLLADVIMQFSRVRDRQVALPLEPFRDPGNVRPVAVEQGLEGRVIAPRDPHALVGPQQYVFLDKGRGDGVVPGDVFEAYHPPSGVPGTPSEDVRLQLLVVHTREESCTALVIGVRNPDVRAGTPVRLVKKMPS